jgi:hypothetical protein
MALPQRVDLAEPPAETNAEEAGRVLLHRVGGLTGVLRVEQSSDYATDEPSFRVYVRRDDPEAEYRVYEVERDIYHRYPGARLEVLVLKRPAPSAVDENRNSGL